LEIDFHDSEIDPHEIKSQGIDGLSQSVTLITDDYEDFDDAFIKTINLDSSYGNLKTLIDD